MMFGRRSFKTPQADYQRVRIPRFVKGPYRATKWNTGAWRLRKTSCNGLSHSHVVAKFGVSRTTASRWHRALTAKGLESLRKGKATGRPSRLTPEQKAQIMDVFEQGASALGFPDNRWTPTLLARIIEERFGVRYSLDHVTRLLAKLVLARNQALHTAAKTADAAARPHAMPS